MSEFPLRTFGRSRNFRNNRAGYSALTSEDSPADIEEGGSSNMPLNVRGPAAASRKGMRRERYDDSPEEEATLLGDEHREEGGFDEQPEIDTVSQVRSIDICIVVVGTDVTERSDQPVPSVESRHLTTSHELYPFVLRVKHFLRSFISIPAKPRFRETSEAIPSQYRPESKVQCVHLPTDRILRTV